MVLEYWGLQQSPFASGIDRRRFFRSPTHDEALARLHFLVDEQRRLGLLLAASGCGKSTLLDQFGHEARRAGRHVVYLNLLTVGEHEFLIQLAGQLGGISDRVRAASDVWRHVRDRLAENRYQKLHTLLLFDDADEASSELLEQITRILQLDPTSSARLTVVLAAAPHRLNRLGQRLLSQSELRVDLRAWELEDTAQYLADALRRSGRREAAFSQEAVSRLQELSGGIPRRVSHLANLSLLAAAGEGLKLVDAATVDAVCHELGVDNAYAHR
jgi:type II secretory pathway predicted ATPase ExeA